jgi:hypothetical protein
MIKQSILNIGVFLLGMKGQKAVREGDASVAGGPFFEMDQSKVSAARVAASAARNASIFPSRPH